MITAGIDIGSITTKVALLAHGELLGADCTFTGYNAEKAWRKIYTSLTQELGIKENDVECIVSTGYGRNTVSCANRSVTEITCHAAGAHFLNSEVRSIIDIGGQDSKVIRVDDTGRVTDFAMNDKCAAGTGRFLEVMARALEADLDTFGSIDKRADEPAAISSLCTVFAESEVISLISQGAKRENIIAGIHNFNCRKNCISQCPCRN
jgi:predicted CoA-substrate-specific enzyme activase